MNFDVLLKATQAWNIFRKNHPRFPAFLKAVREKGITEDSVITVEIRYPNGETIKTNVKVQSTDLELLALASSISDIQ